MNWNKIWMSLFGTCEWLGLNIGFWVSMAVVVIIVILMNVVFIAWFRMGAYGMFFATIFAKIITIIYLIFKSNIPEYLKIKFYDKEIFNGDIGIVASVDIQGRTLQVDFDGHLIEYDASELDELVHAYATTIHKAQGSEYPIVVMPVLMNHYVMLQRNLIYTGITRAKKILVLVGTKKAISYAVHHVTVNRRNTLLKERLQGEIQKGTDKWQSDR